MLGNKWTQTIANLKKELACIGRSSHVIGRSFKTLQREAESLKIESLKYSLEEQRKTMARQRGAALLIRDRKKIGAGLAVATASLILGGLITKDKYLAFNAGLSGFNGTVQEFGATRWAVSLQRDLVIVPYDAVPAEGRWVTLDSLMVAINDLKMEALQGKQLGTLDDVIQRLHRSKEKLIYITVLD